MQGKTSIHPEIMRLEIEGFKINNINRMLEVIKLNENLSSAQKTAMEKYVNKTLDSL